MILQGLVRLYDRESKRGRALPYGYSMERVDFVLVLGEDGRVVDVEDLRKERRAPRIPLPAPPKSTVNIAPRFLYGNSAYVLGVMTRAQKEKGRTQRCADEHEAWLAFHHTNLAGAKDAGLRAVLAFCEAWSPDQITKLRYRDEIDNATIALRLDGDTLSRGAPRLICDRPAAKATWERLSAPNDAPQGVCLVTGTRGPLARLHPSIKGVKGAQASGASLVSYNCEAVEHFGEDSQGLNGPTSVEAAHAYATVLNSMLADPSRRVRIGDATAVYWVETEGDPGPAEALLATLLSGGTVKPSEDAEAQRLNETLRKIAAGRPLAEADPGLDPSTRYHLLALGPSAARLVVRWYLVGTLGDLARRVGEHWQDMRLEALPWRTPPSVQWLALQTVPARVNKKGGYDRDKDAINPTLPGDILRSILTGQRYPTGLLQSLVQRLATDRDISGIRIAMVRACLARDHRLGLLTFGAPMALDPDNPSPAYQLGRLFAVLENVYRLANPGSERTLADAHYRMSSTQPGAAFPHLLATAQHHLSAIRRAGKGGLAYVIGKDIEDITARLTTFPRALNSAQQGEFALGYYHQREHRGKKTADTNTEAQGAEL
jgi:CRISPR-associated protein Csd1